MPIRITGMNSGLDTEALVSELVSAYKKKTEKYEKAQTKLTWKQDAWSKLNKKINSFYSNISSLKYSSAYSSRTATVSDTTKASVSVASSAVNGTYTLKIASTAKTGYLTGGELAGSITDNSKLSDLGYTADDGVITVKSGDKSTDINVTSDMSVSDFVSKLNEAGVKASYDTANHRIFVAASDTGAKNDFSLTGSNTSGMDALNKLGLSVASTADTESYKSLAKYALNADGTAYITGYDADGNAITNGTYDEEKTKANIANILSGLTDSSTTVTNNTAQIAYAKAYKEVEDVNAKLDDSETEKLQTLLKEKDLTNVYIDSWGNVYDWKTDGTYTSREDGTNYDVKALADAGIQLYEGSTTLVELQEKAGMATKETADDGTVSYTVDAAAVSRYTEGLTTISTYEADAENADEIAAVKDAYAAGTLDIEGTGLIATLEDAVTSAKAFLNEHDALYNSSYTAESLTDKISNAAGILDGSIAVNYSSGATRVNGTDATIILNNASYTSSSNNFTINGLTVNALAATGIEDEDEITITVANNTQGLYDKIKSFIKEYNTLINEMTSLYNADVVKGMDPLTTDEKDAMTDTEIELWEDKIKDSILRRDDSLESIMSLMKNAMLKSYTVNGKNYSLSSFGISTLGVLNAQAHEENAFHIDGDSEDSVVSGKTDKLMEMLNSDPDTVVDFMKQLSSSLYDSINKKMSSTKLSSFGTVYNDKEMAQEYSDYTTTISKWEDKLASIEDSYYKKFAAMESALATLQSQQSQLAGLLG